MKRTMFLAFVLILASAVSCFAIGAGVGVRATGMGGTGIATANDITAAYFNPAGLMYGPENFEMQVFAGGTAGEIQALTDAASDPDYLSKHFDEDLNISAAMNVGLGISARKVGVTLLTNAGGVFIHPKSSIASGQILAQAIAMVPLTLGSTFSTPGLPIASMSVGVNLKPIQIYGGGVEVGPAVGTGTRLETAGSGFGFDIGMQTKITPLISFGAVVRNLSASYSTKTKSQGVTVATDGTMTDVGAETEVKSTDTLAPEIGVGVGFVVPITGTLIAVDAENYSVPDDKSYNDYHIGLEQGFLFNMVMLRAGYFTDGPTEDTYYTYGLGLSAGPLNLGVAAANSQVDMARSISTAQIGLSF